MLLSATYLYRAAPTALAALMARYTLANLRGFSHAHTVGNAAFDTKRMQHRVNSISSVGGSSIALMPVQQSSQFTSKASPLSQSCTCNSRNPRIIPCSTLSRDMSSSTCSRSPLLQGRSTRLLHSSKAYSCSSISNRAYSSSSSSSSETVTRTVLGWCAAVLQSGVSPAGVSAFASASEASLELPSSIRVTISPVGGDTAEQLSDCLLGFGAQSVVVEESRQPGQAEQEKFGAEAELWDACKLMVHFPLEHDVDATLTTVKDILDLPGISYTLEHVVDQEWVEQIKSSYVPVQIAEQLYIVPEWSEPTDAAALNIRLTPGVAFGTGEHPTTKLCLRYLASLNLKGTTVCDYGTGSGVLAIAALLMGANSAVGTDTDALAVRAAEANATLNDVHTQFRIVKCGANLSDPDPLQQLPASDRQFYVVVANILRGPLLELQPRLTSYCKPGARLALSGILTEQAPDVVAAYSAAFENFQISSEGSWALVTAQRKRH